MISRDQAWDILCEFTKSENLRKHALAVEACMRAYAERFGEDVEMWGITGLLHDFDWEIHPSIPDHPLKGEPILAQRGVPENVRKAILAHASETGVPRDTLLAKALFACDELTGLIVAVALVKPGKSLGEVDVRSVKKKMKDKAFARGVNRDDIRKGAEELGIPLEEHIDFCIRAMQGIADRLGLSGQKAAGS